jgi:hypothetical protein
MMLNIHLKIIKLLLKALKKLQLDVKRPPLAGDC